VSARFQRSHNSPRYHGSQQPSCTCAHARSHVSGQNFHEGFFPSDMPHMYAFIWHPPIPRHACPENGPAL